MAASSTPSSDSRPPEPGERSNGEIRADRTDRQALLMGAIIFLITLACWGSAQFACNRRPPQYKDPAPATTEQLSGNPKDAAIEFRQRELSGNLAGALELADGSIADDLKPRLEQCRATPATCAPQAQGTVFTKAELVRFEGPAAYVKTTSTVSGQEQSVVLRMERRGPIWKAVGEDKAE